MELRKISDPAGQLRNVRIGDVLKEYGYVNEEQLSQALAYQKKRKGIRLGAALMDLGLITEGQMLEALAKRLNLKKLTVSQLSVDLGAVNRIPEELAVRYRMLAVEQKEDCLTVLTNDPLNFYGLEDIRQTTGMNIELMLCEAQPLERAIRYYYSEVQARRAATAANDSQKGLPEETLEIEDGEDDTPIINLFNSLVQRAYHNNASDIHIEPFEDRTAVRMRIDGALIEFVNLQRSLHASLIARIKILGGMDIAEHRLPQDGHIRMKIEGQTVNMRISVLPTVYGEKAVIRLLAGNTRIDYAGTYGMREPDYEKVKRMLAAPNGLLYLTGPTGSGKTTTLYMILADLARRPVNICTIEDPVERNLANISQCQVNPAAGMTFDVGLRALLRQDPDIIMVGETRDRETASTSVRAAITGHLVLSTLHTNDAASAVVRLEDMGVEPYLVANSVVGVVAQRLMRKLCPYCAKEAEADAWTRNYLGRPVQKIRTAAGCSKCNHTGYRGRIAVHEVLCVDPVIRQMIADRVSLDRIREYGRSQQGMTTLRDSGSQLVAEGVTTMEELLKVACYEG